MCKQLQILHQRQAGRTFVEACMALRYSFKDDRSAAPVGLKPFRTA